MATHIDQLPFMTVCKVLSYLSFRQRQTASLTCRVWYEAAHNRQFLVPTFIHPRAKADHDWQGILKGLSRWKIPNLVIDPMHFKIKFIEDVSRHLSHNITYLCIIENFNVMDVILCIQHFPNLETLKLKPGTFEPGQFLGEDEKIIERFKESLNRLQKVIFKLPDVFRRTQLLRFIKCFSGVRSISWLSGVEPWHQNDDHLYHRGVKIIKVFQKYPTIAQNLDELDLSWAVISYKDFRDFISTPSLQLRSLTFLNADGEGDNLRAVASSHLALESLKIWCYEDGSSNVRHPLISTLLSKKPSLRLFKCGGIVYPTPHGSDHELVDILRDWPDIHFLDIGGSICDDGNTELCFTVERKGEGRVHSLHVRTDSLFDNLAIYTLKEHSPGLLALDISPSRDVSDICGMRVVAESFANLEVLSVGHSARTKVDFGLSGLSCTTGIITLAHLQILYLYKCHNLEDDNIVGLRFPNLRQLWLTEASNITDKAIISVASSNPRLQFLSIGSCCKITDASIEAIAFHLKGLRCLFLSYCNLLNSRAAKVLVEGCQRLEFIDVGDCSPPFTDALRALQCDLPFLQRVLYSYDEHSLTDCVLYCSWGFAVHHVLPQTLREAYSYRVQHLVLNAMGIEERVDWAQHRNKHKRKYGNCPSGE